MRSIFWLQAKKALIVSNAVCLLTALGVGCILAILGLRFKMHMLL